MSRLPSTLRSIIDRLQDARLRLLIAGIIAIALVVAIGALAASPDRTSQDEVAITNLGSHQNPEGAVTVGQDFSIGYTFKPHAGLRQYNLRVTIDGRPVENRRRHNENGWNGKKGFRYNFRYGMNEGRSERTNGFDWNLLKPGDHKLVVRACNNNVPATDCKGREGNPGQLARAQVNFKVSNQDRDAVTTSMQGPIAVYNAGTLNKSHIKDPTDTRLQAGNPASDPADESTDVETVESDLLPEEVTGESAGGTEGFDAEFEIAVVGPIIADTLIGKARANHVRGTHPIQVWVNPRGLSPGQVTVQIYGGACNENVKVVGGGGDAVFGGCPNGHAYTAAVHQDQFTNGNQHCVAGAKTTGVGGDNQANLHYNCNPINPPGPQPPPGPVPGRTHQIKVSLNSNVDPKTINLPVTAFGGYCNGPDGRASNHVVKQTGGHGEVTFGGCTSGSEHSVSIPERATASNGVACLADNGTRRDIARLQGDWNPTFHYQCGGSGSGNGGGDTVKNRAPWMALTALGSQTAFVDVFKLGAGKDLNVGQVKEVRAIVDGQVTDSHAPQTAGHGYKYWPTVKHERLNLGNIADGAVHQVKLQAISARNVPAEITINVQASTGTAPLETEPNPSAETGSISASVYDDVDGSGTKDADETGVEGVTITAEPDEGDVGALASQESNAEGNVTFPEVPNGSYSVHAEIPGGFVGTTPDAQDVMVEGNTVNLTFGVTEDVDFPEDPGDEPADEPTDEVPAPREDDEGRVTQAAKITAGDGVLGNLSSLPKTGQVGLIAFITFLLASAAYYGTQYYREHTKR